MHRWLPWLILLLVAAALYTWRPLPESSAAAPVGPALAAPVGLPRTADQEARVRLRLDTEELTAAAMGNFADQLRLLNKRLALAKRQVPTTWGSVAEASAMAELMALDIRTTSRGDFGRLLGGGNLLPEQQAAVPKDIPQAAVVNQMTLSHISRALAGFARDLAAGQADDQAWAAFDTARTQIGELARIQAALADWRDNPSAAAPAAQDATRLNAAVSAP